MVKHLKIFLSASCVAALVGSSVAAPARRPFVPAAATADIPSSSTTTTGAACTSRPLTSTAAAACTRRCLSLRGGAGPLNADTISKVYAGVVVGHGALDYLSPKAVYKMYEIELVDSITSFVQSYVGGNQIATVVTLLGTVFSDQPALKAIGVGLLPGALKGISHILDGTPQELGIHVPMQYVHNAAQLFVVRSLLTDAPNAPTVLKYFLTYLTLAAVQCRVAPQSALKTWGFPEGTALQTFASKLLGQSGLALAVLAYTLGVEGGGVPTAVGRMALVYGASLLEMLVSGQFTEIGVDNAKLYPWIGIAFVSAATLLL